MRVEAGALQKAIQHCAQHCLFNSSEWLAELYSSLPLTRLEEEDTHSNLVSTSSCCPNSSEETIIEIACTYFRSRQWRRVAFLLDKCQSNRATFLRAYSNYLAATNSVQSEQFVSCFTPPKLPMNEEAFLNRILEDLEGKEDPFNFYLRGIILFQLRRRTEAVTALIQSVSANPWIWSAWLQLSQLIEDPEELSGIYPLLPNHPMTRLFSIRVMINLQSPSDEDMQAVDELLDDFPDSLYLLTQKALIYYHQKDWESSEQLFNFILGVDPRRTDEMDIYSNILYVSEKRSKLAKLARHLLALDKDQAGVCCVVGNYYSLRGDHERAIKCFRKALHLDRAYLPAWTLMGHEYIELKHSEAAIGAYRSAIDLNRRDYRAWFGLGQVYELLGMHNYALHYYQRATALRPYDVRVWQATAMCYADLSRPKEAIQCYKRAQIGADPKDTVLHLKIATLYDALGDFTAAALYHRRAVSICQSEGRPVADYAKSCIYLARFYLHSLLSSEQNGSGAENKHNILNAKTYLQAVSDSNAEEIGIAADLLRRLNKLALKGPCSRVTIEN